jgi:predicted TIM-barrel fold metal-dependent hydrolase
MIIDCHVHLNNYHEQVSVALDDSLASLQAAMAEAGVDYALVLTSYIVNPNRPSTAEVVRAVEKVSDLGVVAGISYNNYRQKDLRELAGFLADGTVKGLKLYPGYEPFYPSDRRLQVVYDLAEEFDVPVMIHSGDTYSPTGKLKYSHPLEIDEVAVDHPNVKFVICHLGNPWLTDCMEVVYKNPNVYADISGLVLGEFTEAFEDYMSEEIGDVILYAGDPTRFLFGTDWPICSMKSYIRFVSRLGLPEESLNAMMYENARRLFKLPVPGSSTAKAV